jgi:dolichol-phosphate mannosyltransferase
MGHPSVTVVAPAYNEEAVIEAFCEQVLDWLPADWELLVVDDGSRDRTPQLLAGVTQDQRLRVVTHPRNLGMGAALMTGFAEARGDLICTIDADLSHPLELLGGLAGACEAADAAFGSRFVPGGGMTGVPRWRAAVSRVGNAVFRALFRSSVRDLTTGLRAYRSAAVRDLPVRATGFDTQLEISVRLLAAGARVAELPLQLRQREAGESKMRYLRLVRPYGRTVLRMLVVRWLRRRSYG